MDKLTGRQAVSRFLEEYDDQVEISGEPGNTLKISVPGNRGLERIFVLDNLYLPNTGGLEKRGLAFNVSKPPERGFPATVAQVNKGSDLQFYLNSQAPWLNFGEQMAVYPLDKLMTHDWQVPDLNNPDHKILFTWSESIYNTAIPNTYCKTAGDALDKYMAVLIYHLGGRKAGFMGERARMFSGTAKQLMIPWYCTRPSEGKMLTDIFFAEKISGYALESGAAGESEEKIAEELFKIPYYAIDGTHPHVVVDDLRATDLTLQGFINALEEKGVDVKGAVTFVDLGYVNKEAILETTVYSVLREDVPGSPHVSGEMKKLWDLYEG